MAKVSVFLLAALNDKTQEIHAANQEIADYIARGGSRTNPGFISRSGRLRHLTEERNAIISKIEQAR